MAAPKGTSKLMSELKSRIMTPATTSHYEVYFQAPDTIEKEIKESGRYDLPISSDDRILINLSCIDTTLPGSSFMTHEATNDRNGVTEKHVYRRSYENQMDFTFMVDRSYRILRFFEGWMGSIINEDKFDYDPANKKTGYLVKFPKEYQADYITITKFEKDVGRPDEQSQLQYILIGAYPQSINSMPISYEQSDLLKVTVTMAFTRYYIKSIGKTFNPLAGAKIVGKSEIGPNQTQTEFLLPNGDIAVQVSSYGSSVTTYPDSVEPGDFT